MFNNRKHYSFLYFSVFLILTNFLLPLSFFFSFFQDNLIGTLLAIFGNVLVSISLCIQVHNKLSFLNRFTFQQRKIFCTF